MLRKRMVKMPASKMDLEIRQTLADETLPESVKAPILEEQKRLLRAILEAGKPGWQDEIPEEVYVHEHSDPCGGVNVVQHGEIE